MYSRGESCTLSVPEAGCALIVFLEKSAISILNIIVVKLFSMYLMFVMIPTDLGVNSKLAGSVVLSITPG